MPTFNWNEQIQGLPPEWRSTLGEGVKIALFDTGISLGHPGVIIPEGRRFDATDPNFDASNPNAFGNGNVEGQPFNQDHGTISASILIGSAQGEEGLIGIAPKAEVYFFRVFDQTNNPKKKYFLNALRAAINLDVDIICAPYFPSSGPGAHDALLQEMADKKINLFVPSSVNSDDPDVIMSLPFPANHPTPIVISTLNDITLTKAIERNVEFRGIHFVLPEVQVKVYPIGNNNQAEEQLTQNSHAVVCISGIAALYLAHRKQNGNTRQEKDDLIDGLKTVMKPYSANEMRDMNTLQFYHF